MYKIIVENNGIGTAIGTAMNLIDLLSVTFCPLQYCDNPLFVFAFKALSNNKSYEIQL